MLAAHYTPKAATQAATEDIPWYALRVRSNFEHMSSTALQGRGLEIFLPTVKTSRRWSDRVKVIEKPLFPGYVFCRFAPEDRVNVLRTAGVVHVVGNAGDPLPVDPVELDYIRTVVMAELAVRPHPFIRLGQRVRIDYGPLAGAEGILTAANGESSVILSIHLLQRSIAVTVDAAWIRAI